MSASRLINIRGHTFCPRFLNAQSHVLDFGANEGGFSREVARRFDCRVYAVEPNPTLFESIPVDPRISKFNLAITPSASRVPLYLSANPEASSIYPLQSERGAATIEVAGVSLDGFISENQIPHVDLLKVDIEGAEIAMFDSTPDATLASMAQITVEFHAWLKVISVEDLNRVIARLESLGFFHISFSRRWGADSLFVNRKIVGMSEAEYRYIKYFARPARLIRKKLFGQSS